MSRISSYEDTFLLNALLKQNMPHNRIVIFSNGIADVQRSYVVRGDAPTRISIPVRQDHVGDVLASLNVFGTVRLSSPPSYRPVNQSDGNLTLDTKNVLEGLADQLSGAHASVDTAAGVVEGVVVGLHGEPEGKPAERTYLKSLVVLGPSGFVRVALRDITALRFADAGVRDEIDKALKRNFQKIKPHSTFVELTLTTAETETEAVLQYTLPAAAWKISYRLIAQTDGRYELHGFAVVDNNTDEDWNDFRLAVVTGEPITFSTDLAESKTPLRQRVNVVRSDALSAVEIEEGERILMQSIAGPAAGAPAGALKMSKSRGLESKQSQAKVSRDYASMDLMVEQRADLPKATSREIGDFCIFEADEPVTIGANRSAIVPVFQTALAETRSILHYNESNHAERSFRTVQFKNETGHPLGRGVCTVFETGTYAGSCVLPASVIGEKTLLAHALESGVKIRRKYVSGRDTVIGLQLSQGACSIRRMNEKTYSYRVESLKDETFELLVDHEEGLTSPKRRAIVKRRNSDDEPLEPSEKLKAGVRYLITLAPHETLELVVYESRVETSVVRFIVGEGAKEELKTAYLQETLIASNGPLSQHPGLVRCLEIQAELDTKKQEISDAVSETARLAERQERLRKNIAAGGQDAQTAQWRVDLGKAENRILEIDEQLVPRLREEERTIRNRLRAELQALSADWESESTTTS
ncbi:MAG: hypothetical protein C0483_03525 [Pirellula sp.]|nr:hypothetical protein [Pirellula sp.]